MVPRVHTTHSHGVLSSAHPWRALVVPKQDVLTKPPLRGCGARWIKWSELIRRVFLTDILICQLCGGPRRIVQHVNEGPIARKILEHLGLPSQAPTRSPARAPDQLDAWNTGPPGTLDAEPPPDCDERPPPFEYDQRVPETDFHVS